jgi:hypothetical protein
VSGVVGGHLPPDVGDVDVVQDMVGLQGRGPTLNREQGHCEGKDREKRGRCDLRCIHSSAQHSLATDAFVRLLTAAFSPKQAPSRITVQQQQTTEMVWPRVLKDSTLQGNPVLKRSTCEEPWFGPLGPYEGSCISFQ